MNISLYFVNFGQQHIFYSNDELNTSVFEQCYKAFMIIALCFFKFMLFLLVFDFNKYS